MARSVPKWLFEQLNGKGNVVEMRGIDGVPGDADRHQGFTEALKDYPEHQSRGVAFHGLGAEQDGAAGQGFAGLRQADRRHMDLGDRFHRGRCLQDRQKPFMPVVGADNNGFIGQLIDLKGQGSRARR